jgi:hypothetical protein
MTNGINVDFCQVFQYPTQLTHTLKNVAKIASQEPVESVLLIGSTARGEISVQASPDTFDLWSDIEFFLVPQSGQLVDKKRLQATYQNLCCELNMRNPFFHIDFTILPLIKFPRLPRRIGVFEAKRNGQVLWGKDIRREFPEVTLNNLDYGNTKHLVLIRLTEMLLYIPWRIVTKCASPYEEKVFSYVQARNALDILTILLPHEGVLLPSYHARNSYIQANYGRMTSQPYMGAEFPVFSSGFLQNKLTLEFSASPLQLYQRVLKGYADLLRFLLTLDPQETLTALELCDAIERSDLDLNDQKFFSQQRLGEWKLLLSRLFTGKPIVRATVLKKRLISILLLMHQALLGDLRGDGNTLPLLMEARQRLQAISLQSLPQVSTVFAQEWLGLRQAYVDLFTTFYVSKRAQRPHYQQVLEWRDG